jgi:Glycosyl transferase family 2
MVRLHDAFALSKDDVANVLVIIPALNEADSIGTVIGQLHSLDLTRIRVVDNGSTDSTSRVTREAGAEVLIERRRGYGAACWRGLQNVPEKVEWILFCDADGCDVLEDLPRLLAERNDADFILGNRQATIEGRRALTLPQRFGNTLCGWLLRLAWGQQFADLGPMRLIRRRTLEALAMKDRRLWLDGRNAGHSCCSRSAYYRGAGRLPQAASGKVEDLRNRPRHGIGRIHHHLDAGDGLVARRVGAQD